MSGRVSKIWLDIRFAFWFVRRPYFFTQMKRLKADRAKGLAEILAYRKVYIEFEKVYHKRKRGCGDALSSPNVTVDCGLHSEAGFL